MTRDEGAMIMPVRHTPLLSGTFGELRSNHFHSGIDIKSSKGTVGDPLYSVWDGHISRVAVKAGGYGNAIYIDHPNGLTSVYAHMHDFREDIAAYVEEQQYIQESFEVNLYPDPSQFPVSQGDQIGRLGNSGRSFGPHLHFELRDTESEVPINPLHHGADVRDAVPPQLRKLKVDLLDPDHRHFHQQAYSLVHLGKGKYKVRGDTLDIGAWRVGLQLKAYDLMNGASNLNGIYSLDVYVDGQLEFGFELDSISFDDTRYLNAHLDYQDRVRNTSYYHRAYRLPGNLLDVYKESGDRGIIALYEGKARSVRMVASDSDGNASVLSFWLKRSTDMKEPKASSYNYTWSWDEDAILESADGRMRFDAGTFYEDPRVLYDVLPAKSATVHSYQHNLSQGDVPIHKYYDIDIDIPQDMAYGTEKLIIARCQDSGPWINCGADLEGASVKTRVRSYGEYALIQDTIAPTIKPVSFRKDMRSRKTMSFQISDDLSTSGSARKLQYRAEVDGQWILMKHNSRGDRITYTFDDRIGTGEHELRLTVWDDRDNRTEYVRSFIR